MAKDKRVEAEYKLEKLRRTKIRKQKRKYIAAIKREQRKRFCPCCGYDHTGFYQCYSGSNNVPKSIKNATRVAQNCDLAQWQSATVGGSIPSFATNKHVRKVQINKLNLN